jgi:hypothetical protein
VSTVNKTGSLLLQSLPVAVAVVQWYGSHQRLFRTHQSPRRRHNWRHPFHISFTPRNSRNNRTTPLRRVSLPNFEILDATECVCDTGLLVGSARRFVIQHSPSFINARSQGPFEIEKVRGKCYYWRHCEFEISKEKMMNDARAKDFARALGSGSAGNINF